MIEFGIDDYKDSLPGAIRSKRRAQDISQRELAIKSGVSLKTVVDLENRKFNSLKFVTVQKVCRALGINVKFTLT